VKSYNAMTELERCRRLAEFCGYVEYKAPIQISGKNYYVIHDASTLHVFKPEWTTLKEWNPFLDARPLEEVEAAILNIKELIHFAWHWNRNTGYHCVLHRDWDTILVTSDYCDTKADAVAQVVQVLGEIQQTNAPSEIQIQMQAARKRDEG